MLVYLVDALPIYYTIVLFKTEVKKKKFIAYNMYNIIVKNAKNTSSWYSYK